MKKKQLFSTSFLWLILVSATILSFIIVENTEVARVAASVAIIIGALKARLIFIYFMELRWELRSFRIVYEIWTILAVTVILGGYWYTQLMM